MVAQTGCERYGVIKNAMGELQGHGAIQGEIVGNLQDELRRKTE